MKRPFSLALGVVFFATCTVNAAESNSVSFSAVEVYGLENTGEATVSIVRSGSGEDECSVGFRTIPETAFPGLDYTAVSGRVDFAVGQFLVSRVITLIPDTIPEPSKTFCVVLEPISNCYVTGVASNIIVIQDAQTIETMPQSFDSGLPLGWTITTNGNPNGCWRFDDPGGWGNNTGGQGAVAIADSDYYDEGIMDTELRTLPFSVASTALTYLVFKTDYVSWDVDVADVDLSISGGGGPWINLWRRQSVDYPGPVSELIDLTPLAKGQSNVVVRFHYYDADDDFYWQIDDVAILVEPDSNTNGLPDWWETTYYGGLTNLTSKGDSDGDGACDEAEFIAGTSPCDTGVCFRVERFIHSNATVAVHFPTAMGHFYDLQSSTNLMEGSWTTRVARIRGMGGGTNISLSSPGANGYYRLDVRRW
jgi:hypothetical protein